MAVAAPTAAERLGAMAHRAASSTAAFATGPLLSPLPAEVAALAKGPLLAPLPMGGYGKAQGLLLEPLSEQDECAPPPVDLGFLDDDADDDDDAYPPIAEPESLGHCDLTSLEGVGPGALQSVTRSSLDAPFFVVSDTELVDGIPALPREHFEELICWLDSIVDSLEAERAVLLADFEGEMTGFGGELMTAAFLPTIVLDRTSLNVRRNVSPMEQCRAGLLLDLRCESGRRLTRRIMESDSIAKIIWGADGDLTSLRHQVFPVPLEVCSRAVVDAQLAFSPPHARLGMARMLERVPQHLRAALPDKASVEFDRPHSFNRRALNWPLREHEAAYACDDLHRLEAIVVSQIPPNGGYATAFVLTAEIMVGIDNDHFGLAWLGNELGFFSRKPPGVPRRAKAVQIVRHLKSLPFRMASNGFFPQWVVSLKASLEAELAMEGVFVPPDASFAN